MTLIWLLCLDLICKVWLKMERITKMFYYKMTLCMKTIIITNLRQVMDRNALLLIFSLIDPLFKYKMIRYILSLWSKLSLHRIYIYRTLLFMKVVILWANLLLIGNKMLLSRLVQTDVKQLEQTTVTSTKIISVKTSFPKSNKLHVAQNVP